MRTIAHRPATKLTPEAGGTVTFAGQDFPIATASEAGVQSIVGFVIATSGVTSTHPDLGNLTSLRVKAGSDVIYDITYPELRTWLEMMSGQDIGAAAEEVMLPFFLLDEPDEAQADLVAFPLGETPELELTFNNGASVDGTVFVSTILSNIVPTHYPILVGRSLGVAGAALPAAVPIDESGLFRAIGFNNRASGGPTRHKVFFNGVLMEDMTPLTGLARAVMKNPATVTDPLWLSYPSMIPGGKVRAEIDTGSSTVAADRMVYHALRPQNPRE